ncbi:glycosyltransferase [Terrisporobacter vanillatitrophus]|uniref:glycosyltransferase n=1 Tax=Terrisporobacter vanillatitrophus TaxID=3058402 RepID=UPI00336722E0
MKKDILFVIDSLHCAGAEKSLISLLSLIDYSQYNVDLQLFGYGGILESLIPKEVNLLEPLKYTKFTEMSLKKGIIHSIKNLDFKPLSSRIHYSIRIRKGKYTHSQIARIYWQNVSKSIKNNSKKYNIAISYAQGISTFYVAEKVNAENKFTWVNTSYYLLEEDKIFQKRFYDKYKKIVAVSNSAKDIFISTFPDYKNKVEVIYDINNYQLIYNMSLLSDGYTDSFEGLRILTIGRLAKGKRYDIAVQACKILKDKGIKFRWYVLGEGSLKEEIKKSIEVNDLVEEFVLLGVKANPYPYIKDCDIYVQTSQFEGFGLAIAEARMLNKPVVTTRFDAVYNQMIDGKNGIVVDINSIAVSKGIEKIITDIELRNSISDYLKSEKKGNVEEIDKFYSLIKQ